MMHIPSMKDATKGREIEPIIDPPLLIVPLFAKFGSKPQPVVNEGDTVKRYQLIGESKKGFPGNVHSPVSGVVEKIREMWQVDGTKAITVVIRNDGKATEVKNPLGSIDSATPAGILKAIEDAGVVGLGGAQFPTSVKYDTKGKLVRTFIINGAECEPYLTGDYAQMSQRTKELLDGILIADCVLDFTTAVIAVENSNRELAGVFEHLLKKNEYSNIKMTIVPDEYPQGGELQLARTVTGIEMPKGTVPLDKGVIVSNVGTVLAVYDAVIKGIPLTERIITVSGESAGRPGNYRVMIGTPVGHLLDICGIDPEGTVLIAGGPMMSPQIRDLQVPINKGTLGIVALPKRRIDRLNCIWCGYCADVCPMRLMPMKYDQFYRRGKYLKLEEYNIGDCIECAACEYICPSKVPLIESIKEGKMRLKEIKDAAR